MNDYQQLRSLILGEEIEEIAALRSELRRLGGALNDPDAIIERIAPHIDRIVRRKIDLDRETLVGTLAPIIADVLTEEIRHSGEAIAEALAPVIGRAIRVQIKTQRDEIVDALYPVIGTTVAKFVFQSFRDLLDGINTQLNDAFSVKTLRRKLTAKLKGIPESQLLLAEHTPWRVESLFLIQKGTGLLMAERTRPDSALTEPEMVAAMLTAIRSFVNEWIADNGSNAEIDQIEYGNSTIYLEVAGSCYLAAVVSGVLQPRLAEQIAQALGEIVESQGETLRTFNGDRSVLDTAAIYTVLDRLIALQPETQTRPPAHRWPLYILALLIAAGIAYFGYGTYRHYEDRQTAERLHALFEHDPKLALYRIVPAVEGDRVRLDGAVPETALAHYAQALVRSALPAAQVSNRLVVAEAAPAPEAGVDVSELRIPFFFDIDATEIPEAQRYKIGLIRLALALHPEYRLRIMGYSDLSGSEDARKAIAKKRVDAFAVLLTAAGVDASKSSVGFTSSLPQGMTATTYDAVKARAVIVTLIPGERKP